MAGNVPLDSGASQEAEEAVHSKRAKPSTLNGVAHPRFSGGSSSIPQNAETKTQESFVYEWDDCPGDVNVKHRIRVLTWNTLADGLAQYGEFVKVPSALLEWENRAPLLLRELEASDADIICLQEVNHFDEWFLPQLEKLGYKGRFQPKIMSPSARFGYAPDGVAMFYRSSRFDMHGYKALQFLEKNGDSMSQCALLCRLQDRDSDKQLLLATTHLKAKGGADNDATRASQIRQLLSRISSLAAESAVPVVLCGDLNCNPGSAVCAAIQTHELEFTDAYGQPVASTSDLRGDAESAPGQSGNGKAAVTERRPFTTWKFRPGGEKKETIDYIWYRGLDLVRKRRLPTADMIGPSAMPSKRHASDHLPLCCELTWLE